MYIVLSNPKNVLITTLLLKYSHLLQTISHLEIIVNVFLNILSPIGFLLFYLFLSSSFFSPSSPFLSFPLFLVDFQIFYLLHGAPRHFFFRIKYVIACNILLYVELKVQATSPNAIISLTYVLPSYVRLQRYFLSLLLFVLEKNFLIDLALCLKTALGPQSFFNLFNTGTIKK